MKYQFVSVPALGNKQNTFLNIRGKLTEYAVTCAFQVPEFKARAKKREEKEELFSRIRFLLTCNRTQIGTLDALVLLSDDLAKYDATFEQTVNKITDILNTLVKSDRTNGHVREYMLVNDSK